MLVTHLVLDALVQFKSSVDRQFILKFYLLNWGGQL